MSYIFYDKETKEILTGDLEDNFRDISKIDEEEIFDDYLISCGEGTTNVPFLGDIPTIRILKELAPEIIEDIKQELIDCWVEDIESEVERYGSGTFYGYEVFPIEDTTLKLFLSQEKEELRKEKIIEFIEGRFENDE